MGTVPSIPENIDANVEPADIPSQNEVQPSSAPKTKRRHREPTPEDEDRANDSDGFDNSQSHPPPLSMPQSDTLADDDEDSELAKIKNFWQTIPDSLRSIDIASFDPLPSDCLEPSAEHLLMMCSHSKTMALLAPDDKRRLMQPYQGVPCVFVEEASDVLGPHILNVLHFFNLLNNTGTNYASFCVGTSEVSLDFDHESPDKIVRGFVYEGVYGSRGNYQPPSRCTPFSVRNILKKRRDHESGVLRIPLAPIDIKIGWIGAEGTVGGEKKRKMYCCLIVTPVVGFNMWEYIHRVFCAMPEKNAKNYAEELANYKQRCMDFRRIYDHEAFVNLGMDPNEHTDIETKFRYSPGSEGGYFTVLNMFMLPFKIYNLFMTEHPRATNLLVMKCPTFKFSDDTRTEVWNAYLQAYINEAASFQGVLEAGIKQFWAAKPKDRHALVSMRVFLWWSVDFLSDLKGLCRKICSRPFWGAGRSSGTRSARFSGLACHLCRSCVSLRCAQRFARTRRTSLPTLGARTRSPSWSSSCTARL